MSFLFNIAISLLFGENFNFIELSTGIYILRKLRKNGSLHRNLGTYNLGTYGNLAKMTLRDERDADHHEPSRPKFAVLTRFSHFSPKDDEMTK